MLKNVVNYDPNGKKVRDFAFDGGLKSGIFVDISKGDVPYVFTRRPFNRGEVPDMVSIEYVHLGNVAESATDFRRLTDILDHPVYDGDIIFDFVPPNSCLVDYERVKEIRLRGVGD